jgi:hypothetical protein
MAGNPAQRDGEFQYGREEPLLTLLELVPNCETPEIHRVVVGTIAILRKSGYLYRRVVDGRPQRCE